MISDPARSFHSSLCALSFLFFSGRISVKHTLPTVRLVPASYAAACDGLPPPLAKTLLDFLNLGSKRMLLELVKHSSSILSLMIELDPE